MNGAHDLSDDEEDRESAGQSEPDGELLTKQFFDNLLLNFPNSASPSNGLSLGDLLFSESALAQGTKESRRVPYI